MPSGGVRALHRQTGYAGFVLFDTLLALALLAFALLLASYPLYSARDAWRGALLKQYAVHVAFNAIDRIRSNSSVDTSRGHDYANAALWNGSQRAGCQLACTAQQLVYRDAAELQQEWKQHHKEASMRVDRCNGALCLTLWWHDMAFRGAGCVREECLSVRFIP